MHVSASFGVMLAYICTVNLVSNRALHAWESGNVLHITVFTVRFWVLGPRTILYRVIALTPRISIYIYRYYLHLKICDLMAGEFVYECNKVDRFLIGFVCGALLLYQGWRHYNEYIQTMRETHLGLSWIPGFSCWSLWKRTVLRMSSRIWGALGLPCKNPKP